jgi:hypothetical protein
LAYPERNKDCDEATYAAGPFTSRFDAVMSDEYTSRFVVVECVMDVEVFRGA